MSDRAHAHGPDSAACRQQKASAAASTDPTPATAPDVIEEELLAEELRDAFGSGAFLGVGSSDTGRGSAEEKDSGAFATGLGPLPRTGSVLGDFEILGELGRGGMGVVYRTRQLSLNREVALKVLPTFARRGRMAVSRFRTEAQAAARLHHTNIVPIYGQGAADGLYYYAMELVDGHSLDRVIQSSPELLSSSADARRTARRRMRRSGRELEAEAPGTAEAVPENVQETPRLAEDFRHLAHLFAEVADALEHAHRHGVIHRDIKPHNLLLGRDARLHVTDFGLARLADGPDLTLSGEVLGTPSYFSPEQVRSGASIDHRTDIYSLGVTLYELLTWRRPFDGETREQILEGIRQRDPIAPRRVDSRVPRDLETICLRAMHKDPESRYQTAAEMAQDLRRFAEGRPIRSRRAGLLERAAKWARRHRAASTAIVAGFLVLVLSGGLAVSILNARWREANRLIETAHDRLVYEDFHQPSLVAGQIQRASVLGAERNRTELVRGLAGMNSPESSDADQALASVLAKEPRNMEALYALAFIQWETRRPEACRQTVADADALGGPVTAAEWFLRGLAVHFWDPDEAVQCYRMASSLRAAQGQFYPQAVLHLGRAHNQRMYAYRSIESFSEAERNLRLLIEHGHYGAYPYYLLSIAHRLAAEISRGSVGARDDARVEKHYAASLRWARDGQTEDPTNDRPVTAEAECLESMGEFDAAIAARTEALPLASERIHECEQYHYRWRLNLWTGRLDDALADITAHAECDPASPFYAHLYPSLVLSELGDTDAAVDHAYALAGVQENDAMSVIWAATALRLLGHPKDAADLLSARAEEVDFEANLRRPRTPLWVETLYQLAQGHVELEDALVLADEAATPWRLRGEAWFHYAARELGLGHREAALEGFMRSYRSFDGEERYTFHAKVLLELMAEDPSWPKWVAEPRQSEAAGPTDHAGA